MRHRLLQVTGNVALALTLLLGSALSSAQSGHPATPPATPPTHWGPVSISLENVPYPYPVQFLGRNIMGQDVRIAYMDAAPTGRANGRSVVLLHGSSYYGWYWEDTIAALTAEGYRVITVDRLGWGRSSKPVLPYSHELHSANTRAILEHLGIDEAAVVGHSLGGRMASYFAFTYPEVTTQLVMVNPIALGIRDQARRYADPSGEDVNPDLVELYRANLAQEQRRVVDWKPEFLEHVRIRYSYALSGEYPRLELVRALNRGLTSESISGFWPQIETPTLLIGGAEDGPDYPDVSRAAVDLLANGELLMIPNVGHNPHLESPELFNDELIRFLSRGT
ncbi:MAG: alpha/beta hydrolase [Pseudomonadales bacterium]